MKREELELYTDYLISGSGAATATGLSGMLDGEISHDQVTRFLSECEYTSKDLWGEVKTTVRKMEREDGVLIFDDTIQEKAWTDENEVIIIEAQAHGTGSEQELLLLPVVTATAPYRTATTVIAADSGYHSEANVTTLAERHIDACLPDNGYRKRDARYADQAHHKAKPDPLWDKTQHPKKTKCFTPAQFKLAEDHSHCVCPAGMRLYRNGANCTINGYVAMKFAGAQQDCVPCTRRKECLRTPHKTKTRQVSFFQGRRVPNVHVEQMKTRIDSDHGRQMFTRRFATVDPVFGNLRGNKQLNRFTLREKNKWTGSGSCIA